MNNFKFNYNLNNIYKIMVRSRKYRKGGNVNVSDVVVLVDYILSSETFNNLIFDINADGDVNVSDIVQLVNLILNQ